MDTLNPNIPTPELARLLTTAAGKMKEYRLPYLTPQLLLRVFLDDPKCGAYQILSRLQKERGFDLDDLTRRVEQMARSSQGRDAKFNFTDDFGRDARLADEMLVILDEGLSIAQARDELKVGSGHALAAMAHPNVTTYGVLQRIGVTGTAVIALLESVAQNGTAVITDYIEEAKKGSAPPLYERQELLRDLNSLLALAQRRHVILVGPEGAGKRSLIYSLAQQLAEGNGAGNFRSVVQINESALLENPLAAVRAGLRRASGGILLAPGIERFFADRLRQQFSEGVSRELHKALLSNEQIIIGTTTPGEYDRLRQHDLIRQHSNRLDVPPATTKETIAMLNFHKQRLEQEYEVEVDLAALETAVQLANQYIQTIALPASAVRLADRACALVRMAMSSSQAAYPGIQPNGRLDAEDVMQAAAQMTNIPITKLTEDEKGKYASMVEHLHQRLIGQEEAVLAVSRAVKTARVGLRDKKRPIGSFLFLGPSGVGKTELAKALAEFMFGTEQAMLVLDMSEYQEEASVNKLIGAPPGYVGFEGGGRLTNFVRERPYTVVLFDEVEKAHQRVFDVLLQVLEEGRLTDSQGNTALFSETVVIMTSNLGSPHMMAPIIGERERDMVMAEVHRFFRPEFLNRIDEVVMFHQLSGDHLVKILDLMLAKEIKLAKEQGLELALTPGAKSWLLAQNNEPQFGARPLRRLIARFLREPLADYLLTQDRKEGGTAVIIIDAADNSLKFQMA
ncbi:MAG: ATP-dependent Clp protease ATP-binding subunit [Chloroflexi bacterium]|nr:ATP-dependent Clp protease ATP-binding subunit [Ardenticatenaceae bacterium]MBL1129918.1 ATP-dependent Clp protease ATP-binding subunit [Chloroflexota bacterium]NOG36004.1 ATP-dependent Clp protease ATP-binding subunit [Chloroflexota bacterium]GIK59095.1 MAG: chaperone protein ClpB [Chloroflexota bacterium]